MKVIAIVLLGLLALQQVVASPEENLTPKGIKDEITKIINSLMGLISNTMENILEEVNKAISKIWGLMGDGVDLVNAGIDGILDMINDFEKKALDLGLDITMCVVDQRKLVEELRVDTIATLNKTANRIVGGINEIKGEAIDTIDGYINVVQKLLDDFNDCSILNPICMGKVMLEATATSVKLTAELPLVALRIVKTVGETVIGGTADLAKITADFTSTTVKIKVEIATCVAELMPIY